jgi:flavodoxin I
MKSLVVYGSHFGNTQKVAEAIATELGKYGTSQALAADVAPAHVPDGTDLLVVGGPTEAFRMTAPVAGFLGKLEPQSVSGIATAVFDTRMRPRWWMLGYAGPGIARKLRSMGANLVAPAEGFLVEGQLNEAKGRHPVVAEGELARAATWAAALASKVAPRPLASTRP